MKLVLKSILAYLIVFFLSSNSSFSKITMTPYLQAVTQTSAWVLIETDSKNRVTVEYGITKKLAKKSISKKILRLKKRGSKRYIHKVQLAELKPATVYYYKASVKGKSKPSKLSRFSTAYPKGKDFRWAIMGDCRSNPKVHNNICAEMIKHKPLMSVYLGDLCNTSRYKTWKSEFFVKSELELISQVPFYNAIGNHEDWTTNTKAFQQAPVSKSKHQAYYSFDWGDVHFLILSTEHRTSKGSSQYKFAQKDLAATKKKWKVVAFHNHAYCAGGHGENKYMKRMSKNIFVPNKVDIVLNGHSHFYQHNLVDGIHHLIVAGGGAPLYNAKKADYVVKSARKFHYGMVDVTPQKLDLKIYDLKGNVIDSLVLKKEKKIRVKTKLH